MSMQTDLLNPELGYRDEGLSLTDPSLYEAARRPFGLATMLPPVAYRCKTLLELESEKVWTRSWAVVGLHQQIPHPGDLLPFTLGFHGLHVQRNVDGSLSARMNRHQHAGCRFVPAQCRTGTQTRCSITSCGYTRDADAMSAGPGGTATDEMYKFVGLVPERLRSVKLASWGPFLFVNLDPECAPLVSQVAGFTGKLPAWMHGSLAIHSKLWIDVKANWKEMGASFLDPAIPVADTLGDEGSAFAEGHLEAAARNVDERLFWAFPNLLLAVGPDHALAVVLQSTAPGKTLCRLFTVCPDTLSEDIAARVAHEGIVRFRACAAAAEEVHLDHALHGTASRPGTFVADSPRESSFAAHALNRFLSAKVCAEHKYYWTAPIMDGAMLMRGVR